MSAFSISPASSFCPAGTARFSVIERLLRLAARKYADSPPANGGPQLRVSSPPEGGSTLMTSAPMSPSIMAQVGPASTRVRSSTRMPASAPLLEFISVMPKPLFGVMAGLVPAIYALLAEAQKGVDARDKRGHHAGKGYSSRRSAVLACAFAHRGPRVQVPGAAFKISFKLLLVAHAELLEIRLAALKERVHAFEALLGAPHMRQQLHAVLPGGVEQVRFEIQALFGHAQGLRAVALDGLAPDERLLEQILRRHAFVDEADFDGLAGGEGGGAEVHLARRPFADDARKILRGADGRTGADLGTGLAQYGILRRDDEVAPQGKLVAAAHAPAVDHGDGRDGQAADRHRKPLHSALPHPRIAPLQPHHHVKIAARGKRLVARAGHHHTRDRGIVAGCPQGIDQFLQRLLAKPTS